ncbi:MAG: hypothetical protein JWN73_1664 [Betaproteobacteria bacterium]|nr:hypothetical protein [Betaproteobacteria bacterium]
MVEASFARSITTPNTSKLPWDEFIEQEKAALRQCLVEPFAVIAKPGAMAIAEFGFENKTYEMIAIANADAIWLFYEPASGFYYKGWNEEGDRASLYFLGFCSDDALTEWRG